MTIDGNPRDLEGTAISIHFVTDCLRNCKAKNIVLILDMCRNENHDAERKSVESIETSLRTLVKEREGQQGIITLFSCGRGESSYEIADLGQGAFTYALLEGLRSQTIVKDLESYLARRVPELHKAAGKIRKQVPLLIPEPGWKYDQPILSHYVTEINVSRLKEMAIDAESDGEFDQALQLWEQVSLSATKSDDRRRALDRIRDLMSRSATNQSPTKLIAQTSIIIPESVELDSFKFKTCQLSSEGVVIQRQIKTAPYFRQDLGDGVFIDMVVIPAGKFQNIQIPEFCMAKTLITQAQWEAVAKLPKVKIELKLNPSRFKGPKRPVENVNWWMAEEFCKRLTIVTKRDYRLPAEAQWEYACRAGSTTNYYYFGDTLSAEVANYGNSTQETTEVGKYPANAWGLYDMHGNLWEWCADHWSDQFKTDLKDSNPIVSSKDKADRVLRGGSWFSVEWDSASGYRSYYFPTGISWLFNDGVGFRVVCSSPRTGN